MGDFLKTVYGKVIATLTIIALVMGIVTEGIAIYRQSIGAMVDREQLIKITAKAAMTKQKADFRTAPLANMTEEEELRRIAQTCKENPKDKICSLPGLQPR